jgi:ethanolamine ammonia-lyase small subunit
MAAPDPWNGLRRHTAARIALGRTGASLPTDEWLRFGVAHALARDAVHTALHADALAAQLAAHGFDSLSVHSAAPDRATYLRRPDLGRRLAGSGAALLAARDPAPCDVAVMVGDGLSARAVNEHALPLLLELRPRLEATGLRLGAVVLALQARVALGDEVGAALAARAVLVLIGERPGLSSPDSLGAYLTWAPQPGRSDAERNCVSNIRPAGLGVAEAAYKIAWLLAAARRLGATGVTLKDESDAPALAGAAAPQLRPTPSA